MTEKWYIESAAHTYSPNFEVKKEIANFYLREGQYLKGELYVYNMVQYSWDDNDRMLYYPSLAAMYIQRGSYDEAKSILEYLINRNWKHFHANLLMGILYDKLNRPGLSRKHFAIIKT